MTIESVRKAAREFVAGVRAIPELVDTGRVPWNPGDPISTITRLVCSRDCAQESEWEAKQEAKALRGELEAERAAYECASSMGEKVELFEPAVPRCRTCPNFSTPYPPQRYGWRCTRHNSHVRQDGSGYCYDHPEANHA
jgi:hypothetical protein